jgi:NADH:ubiquinone oxidoreductase subunit E
MSLECREHAQSEKTGISQEVMEVASTEVTTNYRPVRSVAEEYEIFHVSLYRFRVNLSKNDTPSKRVREHIPIRVF